MSEPNTKELIDEVLQVLESSILNTLETPSFYTFPEIMSKQIERYHDILEKLDSITLEGTGKFSETIANEIELQVKIVYEQQEVLLKKLKEKEQR